MRFSFCLNMRGDFAYVCSDRMMFYNYIMHASNKGQHNSIICIM
jgi:hypothetical protein